LDLGEEHAGHDERIDEVGGQVELEAIQAEQPAQGDAHAEVQADERREADRQAEADRPRLLAPGATFRAERVDHTLQA
jgi:hypothetical protein